MTLHVEQRMLHDKKFTWMTMTRTSTAYRESKRLSAPVDRRVLRSSLTPTPYTLKPRTAYQLAALGGWVPSPPGLPGATR